MRELRTRLVRAWGGQSVDKRCGGWTSGLGRRRFFKDASVAERACELGESPPMASPPKARAGSGGEICTREERGRRMSRWRCGF